MADPAPLRADLVLEGGGVKGIGLTGAAATLARAGYAFPRVAGTSAGAVVGAFLVALQRAGEPIERLEDVARSLDYTRLRDRGAGGRAAGPLARVVDGLSLAFDGGVFEGDYLRSWVEGALADLGVQTFGDLRVDDPGSSASRGPAVRPGGHGERRVPPAARPAALGLPRCTASTPTSRRSPTRCAPRRRSRSSSSRSPSSRPPSGPAGGLDAGRRQRPVQLPDRDVRPHRRAAAALADVRRAADHAPGRPGQHDRGAAAPCRSRCPSWRPCSRPATPSTSTTRASGRAASSSTPPASSPVDFGITDEQQEQLLLAGHVAAGSLPAPTGTGRRYLAQCRDFEGVTP